jgi:hypothetical protein
MVRWVLPVVKSRNCFCRERAEESHLLIRARILLGLLPESQQRLETAQIRFDEYAHQRTCSPALIIGRFADVFSPGLDNQSPRLDPLRRFRVHFPSPEVPDDGSP